jgi:hypothetical protein
MDPMALLLAVVSAIVARRGTDIRSTSIAESEDFASGGRYAAETSSMSVVPHNRRTLTWGVRPLLRRLGSAAYATEPRQAPTATGSRR